MENEKKIRVTIIRREVATDKLSVDEFYGMNFTDVENEIRTRCGLELKERWISPILDKDECSYAGLLDEESFGVSAINGFRYRILIDSPAAAPRDYAYVEELEDEVDELRTEVDECHALLDEEGIRY